MVAAWHRSSATSLTTDMSITHAAFALRPLLETDLPQVRTWRNHPDVRAWMFSSGLVEVDEHQRWFAAIQKDPRRWCYVYDDGCAPAGFVSLQGSSKGRNLEWGFYAAPDATKGTGRAMLRAALHIAFEQLEAHKVCAQVLGFNQRSLRVHEHLGFRTEGCLRQQHHDGDTYHDIICFGLLRSEWVPLSKD